MYSRQFLSSGWLYLSDHAARVPSTPLLAGLNSLGVRSLLRPASDAGLRRSRWLFFTDRITVGVSREVLWLIRELLSCRCRSPISVGRPGFQRFSL